MEDRLAEIHRTLRTTANIAQTTEASGASFVERYYNRPDRFVLDCFQWPAGEGPTPYQLEILRSIPTHKRVAVRGPRGLGKTAIAGWLIIWFALTRDGQDWKVATTAGAWRQLSKYLWPEIHKWVRRVKWDVVGRDPLIPRRELLDMSLKLGTGEAFAAASDVPELIEGVHADHLLYIFDEAKVIPDATFDAAEGAFSGAGDDTGSEAYALAMSTPGEPGGRFYDIHARRPGYEDWHTRRVTLAETVSAGRVSEQWVEARRAQWGETSTVYKRHVEGEFAADQEYGLIPLEWVEMAVDRHRTLYADKASLPDLGPLTRLGVDVGLSGDVTTFAPNYSGVIPSVTRQPRENPKVATMITAGKVKAVLDSNKGAIGVVDVAGIGAGVVHRLAEQGCSVVGFNAAEGSRARTASREFGFLNRRAEAWWGLREALDPESGLQVALPDDAQLIGDLTAVRYEIMSNARIKIESKADLKKRIGRSTDDGDAVMQSFYTERPASPYDEGEVMGMLEEW